MCLHCQLLHFANAFAGIYLPPTLAMPFELVVLRRLEVRAVFCCLLSHFCLLNIDLYSTVSCCLLSSSPIAVWSCSFDLLDVVVHVFWNIAFLTVKYLELCVHVYRAVGCDSQRFVFFVCQLNASNSHRRNLRRNRKFCEKNVFFFNQYLFFYICFVQFLLP